RLRWEPWSARYRVLPLDQRVDVARGLSERTQRRRRASAWRRDAGGPAALGGSSSSSRGAPLYSVEGYFEPRPESSRPRSEQPSPREGSRRPAAPAAPAAFQEEAGDRAAERRAPAPDARTVADEETWPPARPPREQRRARVPEPDPYGWMAEQEADAPRPGDAAGRRRRRGASDASGRRDAPGRADVAGAEEGGAGDADGGGNVWRLGDAERSGLGRAARAARGTERDGAGGTVGPSRHPGRRSESERPRSWAVRSDAVPSAPDLGPGELVGPDEEPAPRTRPAGAGGAREARAPAPGGAAGAVGDASGAARKAPAVSEAPAVPEAPARGGLSGATDDDVGPSRTPPKAPAADAVEESGAGDESREERPRPRLEFPDEF
ncbi:MAG TPA: hypothetical protein VKB31_07480, partial [Trueperaceae bacterium]|nr:hypothetical protein [Trueperaceae bacterium]